MREYVLGLGAAVALGLVGFAVAQEAQNDAVKARRGYFQLVKLNAGPLFGMAKGKVAYDATAAASYAANLDALSSMYPSAMYPAGTDNEALAGQTRALPKIWSDAAGYGEKYKAFGVAADALVANAGGGLDALRGEVGKLGGACKGCHDDYRAKDF